MVQIWVSVLPSFQCFVFLVTISRELYDDVKRFFRDKEINGQKYYKLTSKGSA